MDTQKIMKSAVLDGVILGLEQALFYLTKLPSADALEALRGAIAKKKIEAEQLEERQS
jgi:hypothetical protein